MFSDREKLDIASRHTVYATVTGSHAYGTAVATSDQDRLAVFVPPARYVFGFDGFDDVADRPGGYNRPAQPGDVETRYVALRKFVLLVAGGNPTLLETLYTDPGTTVEAGVGVELRRHRDRFVTVRAVTAHLGYMNEQFRRFTGQSGQKNVHRSELETEHGFDTKYAMHMLRLGRQGLILASTGQLTLPLPPEHAGPLLDVRAGKWTRRQVIDEYESLQRQLEGQLDKVRGVWPETVDWDWCSQFVADLYLAHWANPVTVTV